jgi:hypothetical protein
MGLLTGFSFCNPTSHRTVRYHALSFEAMPSDFCIKVKGFRINPSLEIKHEISDTSGTIIYMKLFASLEKKNTKYWNRSGIQIY